MLWESVTGGLSLLKFGDIYLAALIYVIMYCVPLVLGSVIFDKSVVAGGIFIYTLAFTPTVVRCFSICVFCQSYIARIFR